MIFSFDTSAFIEPWQRHYPRDLFEPYWQWIEQQIADGTVRATELVKVELGQVEDDLLAWAKDQDDLFIPIDEDVQQALAAVVAAFPNLADHHRDRSGADPWVVAQAMVLNCPVVTYETLGKQTKPKIPNACHHFGIKVYSWVDVLRDTGFTT